LKAMSSTQNLLFVALALLAQGLLLSGCGTPGAPQPPSLNLPDRVTDLTAVRAGNHVTLTWTMPKRNTDKLLLKDSIAVLITRKESTGTDAIFDSVGGGLSLAPSSDCSFTDTLSAALSAGSPHPLTYRVVLNNRKGRSAGPSNAAQVLAGEAPAPVTGLSAEMRKQGVVLHWTAIASPEATAIRLHRKLLTPPTANPHEGPLAPQPEPLDQNLLIDSCAPDKSTSLCRALDKTIRFGQSYEYRAQRVARVTVDGKTLELAGELSAPIRVEALDIFPPEVPTGLVAVATAAENGVAPGAQYAIDLSWQPVAETDLAGYAVYRAEKADRSDAAWQRISSGEPILSPAFHDAHVLPGHTYRYAVTSIDQGSHESARSAETEETVPNP